MPAPRWWYDLNQYRQRLQQYSDEELLDVYFHIHPIRYRAHYLCVLRELRRRGIKPHIAGRPFAGLRWEIPQWVQALGWLGRSPVGGRVLFGGLTLLLAAGLMGALLGPIVLTVHLMRFVDPFTALMLLMGMVWVWGLSVGLTYKAGARGGWLPLAVLGSSATLWGFLHTHTFARIVEALHTPIGGGRWGF